MQQPSFLRLASSCQYDCPPAGWALDGEEAVWVWHQAPFLQLAGSCGQTQVIFELLGLPALLLLLPLPPGSKASPAHRQRMAAVGCSSWFGSTLLWNYRS